MVTEWILKTEENCLKYMIEAQDFDMIRDTIYSKDFIISSSTFRVQICPRKYNVYLENRSDWCVRAKYKFSINHTDFKTDWNEDYFEKKYHTNSTWGCRDIFSETRSERDDLLSTNGTLKLQIDIELTREELHGTTDKNSEQIESLNRKVNDQTQQIQLLKDDFRDMESQSRKDTTELKNMIENLAALFIQKGQDQKDVVSDIVVECPVCMEVAKSPMRLKQCGQGHIICDTCHDRTREEALSDRAGNPSVDLCHTCRQVITGRPAELERVLGLC